MSFQFRSEPMVFPLQPLSDNARMATSPRAFLIELYEEYLEEASFLYEQRRTLFNNPEITWKKIGEFEERLEAHIDGLVVGDKLALDVCKRRVAEADFGELFAATCVFCRQDQRDSVLAILDELDPEDADKAGAVADALKYELPTAWASDFLALLAARDPKLAPVLARAFGYRRMPSGPELLSALRRCTATALPEVVWALGRIRYQPAAPTLLDYLKSEEGPVRAAAAIALARMGQTRAIDYCLDQVRSHAWSVLPLTLAGGPRTVALFTELVEQSSQAEYLTALGLLGDSTSVPLLLSRLEQPDTAAAAAIALEALTGAGLVETVFIPDEIDDDELFEPEREQLRHGIRPQRSDGRPFGSNVSRVSQSAEDWNRWWGANNGRFTPGLRHRNGSPVSPAQLLDTLKADRTPHLIRCYCCEELVTRYACDFGFELDSPVHHQSTKLAEAAIWSKSNGAQFRPGDWYFAASHQY